MLSFIGREQRVCNGLSRREVLQAGGAGLFGLSLPQIVAAEGAGSVGRVRAKSILFVFLFGGPSQLESFDMKPDAPSGKRGPYQPIDSRTPGLLMCEHLPRLAAMSDQFSVVRTLNHSHNDHNASHYFQTGHTLPPANRGGAGVDASPLDWPAMGSVVEYSDRLAAGRRERSAPSYIYLPNHLGHLQGYNRPGQSAGWLGRANDPMTTDIRKRHPTDNPYYRDCTDDELTFRIQGMEDAPGVTPERLDRRRRLLEAIEASCDLNGSSRGAAFDGLRQAALAMLSSVPMRQAMDIRRESAEVRDRYGRNLFGQSLLMGRRMIEAGSRFVTVAWDSPDGYGWDSHIDLPNNMKTNLLPNLDRSLSALLDDMRASGLLDETLVVCGGEIGRAPIFDEAYSGGRGHWSYCFPCVLAGAGIRGGVAYGRSDKDAGFPIDKPVSPEDLACTIFDALGIDPHRFIQDHQSRPVPLVDGGRPLRELFG